MTTVCGTTNAVRAPLALDLGDVPESQRAETWRHAAARNFPGLSAHFSSPPSSGRMHGTRCGAGKLWRIQSSPVRVTWAPSEVPESEKRFALLVQLAGETRVSQMGRSCHIGQHDICFLDQCTPFQLEVREEVSHLAILQMPRNAILGRSPWLRDHTANTLDTDDPGTLLLRGTILELLAHAHALDNDQQVSVLTAIGHLLAALRFPEQAGPRNMHWRVRIALAYIESFMADPTLTASEVAAQQGISRRHMDELMQASIGCPVSAHIWARRLEQAATDLVDPLHASRTVTQVAFGVGFADSAHFTRAFKGRYGCTPREWRNRRRELQTVQ